MPALRAFYCLCALWTVITLYLSLISSFSGLYLWLLVVIGLDNMRVSLQYTTDIIYY